MKRLAIIGSGVAGLGCAWFLHREREITVFEKDGHAGGHAKTVEVEEGGRRLPVDTGFMVYNEVTYPLLTRLFKQIGVRSKPTSMSFSVRDDTSGLEYCGSSLNHLFAQRRNLFRPGFWRLLKTINRFNREAVATLKNETHTGGTNISLDDYCAARGYDADFLRLYLLPMSSAVWSTPPEKMLHFPASTLLRFFHNHGFLGLHTQHPWLTVENGSREYVSRLTAPFRDRIHRNRGVRGVVRQPNGNGVRVRTDDGETLFDEVIFACHADQSLDLLEQPTEKERRLLGAFQYQPNHATLHTDESVMPGTRRAWSSWNYRIQGRDGDLPTRPSTHYWMNSLQGVSDQQNYFVSINGEGIAPESIIQEIHYEHPLFDTRAKAAQRELTSLNREPGASVFYCGSYFRYGFHEDGFLSAVWLSEILLGRDPWSKTVPAVITPAPPPTEKAPA